jgi:hypothetical protein
MPAAISGDHSIFIAKVGSGEMRGCGSGEAMARLAVHSNNKSAGEQYRCRAAKINPGQEGVT